MTELSAGRLVVTEGDEVYCEGCYDDLDPSPHDLSMYAHAYVTTGKCRCCDLALDNGRERGSLTAKQIKEQEAEESIARLNQYCIDAEPRFGASYAN